mgnify:CR=1 FL=1
MPISPRAPRLANFLEKDTFAFMGGMSTSGSLTTWFRDRFAQAEVESEKSGGENAYAILAKEAAESPAGAKGLIALPYFEGERTPLQDPAAKGVLFGLNLKHTRGDIYRAILEGLGYALKDGTRTLQKRNRIKIESLRVSGGGSQSDAAMQITADIFNLPAQRPHTHETSALGAAIDAAVGLKLHPDFDSAIRDMTRVANTFEPIPRNRDLYHELYERVYRKLYRRLKPIYSDIRAITGYPAL